MIRGLDDELAGPKYSHVERERRFLVDPALRPDLGNMASMLIEDSYIEATRLRLRRMTASSRIVHKLTKKYEAADPRARPIVTIYLTKAEYHVLAELAAHRLIKRRYALGAFSIDLFEGALAGLELAESEQRDDHALRALGMPDWAIRDVSDDPRYEGGNLVRLDARAAQRLLH